jgi:1-aminocyclopropane-1-carboxylate deaminase/D-cysteine desulfhydrase-like pyridoxal-dependent ACC family enzyme
LPVYGFNHGGNAPDVRERISQGATGAAEMLDLPLTFGEEDIQSFSQYYAPAYPNPSEAGLEAVRLAARTDALILDPVYTGKALAGAIDQIKAGKWGPDDTLIFLHTGGTPAIFAYADLLIGS